METFHMLRDSNHGAAEFFFPPHTQCVRGDGFQGKQRNLQNSSGFPNASILQNVFSKDVTKKLSDRKREWTGHLAKVRDAGE